MERDSHEVTELLARAARGDEQVPRDLLPLLYEELRDLARSQLRRQSPGHTLEPTALVHEVFLKLTRGRPVEWESRAHFLAVAGMAMRQILAHHAERRRAAKRGGNRARVTLAGFDPPAQGGLEADLIDLDAAISRLSELSPEQARIVEMRYLAGGSEVDVALALGVSVRTIRRQWRMARAFLRSELSGGD